MLEPTIESRLLAKEFGIVYDEGAEGIEARACPCLRVSSDLNPSMNPDGVASGSTTSVTPKIMATKTGTALLTSAAQVYPRES